MSDSLTLARPLRLRFGQACFDPDRQRLTVAGQAVTLEPRPLALLGLLIARPGEVVTKDQILDALWSDRTVTESSLTKCVGRLRLALGDSEHTLIRTVHGYGYRLDAAFLIRDPEQAAAHPDADPAGPAAEPGFAPHRPARATRLWPVMLAAGAAALCLLALAWHHGQDRRPPPAEAQALYRRGLQDWAQRSPAGLTKAVAEFTAALRIAPDYAEAHLGLAGCYNLLPEFTSLPSAQAYPIAKAEAARAIVLNPNLAQAHAAYAFALFWGDWDFPQAMAEYARALGLAPDNAQIHHWYATSLDSAGEHARALAEIDRALELDPSSRAIQADRGLLLVNSGRISEARALLTALADAAPDFCSTHVYLSVLALNTGDYAGYLREWTTQARLRHNATEEAIAQAGQAGLAAHGPAAMWQALLDARLAAFAMGTASATDVARSYAALGDRRQALAYLSLAIDRHDEAAIAVMNASEFASLRDDPGLRNLLQRLHLLG